MNDWLGFRLKTREEKSELRERFVVYAEDDRIPSDMPDDSSAATLFVHSRRWEYKPSPSLEVEGDEESAEEYGLPVSLLTHIVRAVNCHDELVTALSALVSDCKEYDKWDRSATNAELSMVYSRYDVLLAKAKGEA